MILIVNNTSTVSLNVLNSYGNTVAFYIKGFWHYIHMDIGSTGIYTSQGEITQ